MSYSKFKNKSEHAEIFKVDSKVTQISDFPDKNLNLILPSENLFKSLKPVLERMLNSKLDDKKVVLIPNGGVKDDRAQMSYVYLQQFTSINNMYLKQLDLDRWPKNILEDSLRSCDAIVISGGLVSLLIKSIDRSGIRDVLIDLIKSGKPTIGFSAGAMLLSETTYFAQHYIGESDPEVVSEKPLGIVDFEIYPHFEDVLLPSITKLLPKNIKGYALRASDAIIVTEGKLLKAGEPEFINKL